MDFHVGDMVVLLDPPEDNRDGWRHDDDSMDMYIGDVGVVETESEPGYTVRVRFETRYRSDGSAVRNYWYCNPEWLKPAEENVGVDDCAELDSMFCEYGGGVNEKH